MIQDEHIFNREYFLIGNFKMKSKKYIIERKHISLNLFCNFKHSYLGMDFRITTRFRHLS